MRYARAFLCLAVVSLSTPVALGQSPKAVIRDGDVVFGVGAMQAVRTASIDDAGSWVALVDTDASDLTRDECVVRSGFLALREGIGLPQPLGATLDDWIDLDVGPNGDLGMALTVRILGFPAEALYWNQSPVAIEGDLLDVPPLDPSSTLQAVRVVLAQEPGALLCLLKVINPAVTVRPVDALVRFRLDDQGNVTQREVLATHGQPNAVLGTPIETLGAISFPKHSLAVNRVGDFVVPVGGQGRRALMKNLDTILAEDLTAACVPGRTWNSNAFAISKVALNDRGDVAYTGILTPLGNDPNEPTNFLIVKNGVKFAQSGDVLPALSSAPLAKGTSQLALARDGDLFWRAAPTTPGGAAFMRELTPVIQENVTVVDGNLVTSIASGDDAFSISPSGRYFVGRVVLQSVGDAVLLVDFGLVSELTGCRGLNQGTLRLLSGASRIGQTVRVGMDQGPVPGALPFVFLTHDTNLTAGCGQATVQGELLLAPPISNTYVLLPWDGVNPSELQLAIPNVMALVDETFYLQGMFGIPGRHRSYRLTNALEFVFGSP